MAYQPEPIHVAARDGDLTELNRLLQEDGGLLNAQMQGNLWLGWTPLMQAAYSGQDAVVARLLALGANKDVTDNYGYTALHGACQSDHPSTLALLIDAGASLSARTNTGCTPLMEAAHSGCAGCMAMLLSAGGDAARIDAKSNIGETALYWAARTGHSEIIQQLLAAGADPTIYDDYDKTPLDVARDRNHQSCIALLEIAIAEPQRPRALLKARALLDAALTVPKVWQDARDKGLPTAVQQQEAEAAAPSYLKRRVAWAQELPRVEIGVQDNQKEKLTACLKYALGLEGGGGVQVVEGQAPPVGMPREVFVELCEMLVPKWARKDM